MTAESANGEDSAERTDIAAHIMGVDVPAHPEMKQGRIDRINSGEYEGQEIRGALAVVREGDRVLELGAGIGIVGGVIARNCKPGEIRAYEANAALLPRIEALYRANGLTSISVRNEVLVSAPGRPETIGFAINRRSYLGSSLHGDPDLTARVDQVPTADFNAVIGEFAPNVLVMDIEGGELDLLEHADLSGVRAIVVEFHPKVYGVAGGRRCKAILREAGFAPLPDLSTRWVWTAQRETV